MAQASAHTTSDVLKEDIVHDIAVRLDVRGPGFDPAANQVHPGKETEL